MWSLLAVAALLFVVEVAVMGILPSLGLQGFGEAAADGLLLAVLAIGPLYFLGFRSSAPPENGGRRPDRLFSIFIVASLVAIAAIGLLVGVHTRSEQRSAVIAEAEEDAIEIAAAMRDREVKQLVGRAMGIDGLAIAPEEVPELDRELRAFLAPFHIVKIKVFNLQSRIIYSTDRDLIGKLNFGNPMLEAALDGRASSKLAAKDSVVDLAEESRFDVDVVETYFPVVNAAGEIIGSFEIYRDVTHDLAAGQAAWRRSLVALIAVLFGVFGALSAIMHRAVRIMRSRGEALTRSRDDLLLLSTAVEQSPGNFVITDADVAIQYVNPRFVETTGFSAEEAIGRDLRVLESRKWPGYANTRVWDEILAGKTWRGESENRDKNGELCWEAASISPIRDSQGAITHFLAVREDITERKQAEEQAARFSRVLERSLNEIYIFDAESLYFVKVNRGARQNLGYTMDELRSLTPLDLKPEYTAESFAELVEPLRTGSREKIQFQTVHRRKDGSLYHVEVHLQLLVDGTPDFVAIVLDISDRVETERTQARLKAAIEAASETIVITDTKGVILYANPAFERVTGYTCGEALGANPRVLNSGEHDKAFYEDLWGTITRGEVWHGHFTNKKKDGTLYHEDATISPVKDEQGKIVNYVAVKRDVTRQQVLERQLLQAQKMESIGQLAAGIAHEINTPTQYVGDNTRFIRDSVKDLVKLADRHVALLASVKDGSVQPELIAELESAIQELDLEFVKAEIPKAIEQTLDGVARVAKIVGAMKNFSHPDGGEKAPTDLNKAIESTITVCKNRWKYVADMETDFADDLPLVPCLAGEFNQVILNVIVNAADAIGEIVGDSAADKGRIAVSTRHDGESIEIRVSDTGGGIPKEIQQKIFDPFFTTKQVGKGTGQGLSICHDVIVNKHGGTIDFEVEPGTGTTFIIRLPIADPEAIEQRGAA